MTIVSLPVMKPRFPSASGFESRYREIIESGQFSNFGPQVSKLESRFSKFLGVDSSRVVTLANATLGIAGSVAVFDERYWRVPSWTFTASVSGVIAGGGNVELIDVENGSHWLDMTNDRMVDKGLLIVCPWGSAPKIEHLTREYPTVIDAAASIGAAMPDLRLMSDQTALVFSLHATKVLGIGEGGLVVCGSDEMAARLRAWSNFGFSGSRTSLSLGTNAKISEFSAAIGHAVLDNWKVEKKEWLEARKVANRVSETLKLNQFGVGSNHVSPYFIVDFADSKEADLVERSLALRGIGSRRWWGGGCHQMLAYSEVPRASLPFTEELSGRTLGLPMFRGISMNDGERIVDALIHTVQKF